jgi:hypothetical protein
MKKMQARQRLGQHLFDVHNIDVYGGQFWDSASPAYVEFERLTISGAIEGYSCPADVNEDGTGSMMCPECGCAFEF